ncbi:hypothetical protein FQR65_LT05849 [Abscondita terminalis]|nr:hypothetical protein FQR65_LT05849 [Abscondita terminalis]
MIHETLLYLWGCPGDLFKFDSVENWINSIDIENFLHPGERELLQRIVVIGLDYHTIQEFIRAVNKQQMLQCKSIDGTIATITPGLYVKAFANGIDDVLEDYRNEIVHLEKILLKNSQLTLLFILSSVEKYVTQFEALKSMIQLIKGENLHGGLLIGKLHSYINSGIKSISAPAVKIMQSLNMIFYRFLCNWIIYGDLVDNYNEFFICDAHCADENFLYPNQPKEINSKHRDDFFDIDFSKKHRIAKPCEVRKFYLNKEMVPSNIPLATAETILFLGRIVWIIRNDPNRYTDDKYQLKIKRDIWEGKDFECYRKLQILEEAPFNSTLFHSTIEECRLKLTKYLWKVVVDEAKLIDHLQLIRDYYALGRGELFQHFILVAEEHLKETANEYIITNLNFVFMETARKLYTENDKSYLRFELTLSNSQSKPITNPWSRLEINFNVTWPLHILFHPAAMGYYNQLFSFLLKVKKTHIDLHKIWLTHKEGKHKLDPAVWTLRNNLMFIVNNLQYYFQVDVIEAQFSIFKCAIQEANQFEDIIRLHSEFLKNLLHKAFLMTAQEETSEETFKHTLYQVPKLKREKNCMVYKTILEILQVCNRFCAHAHTWCDELTEVDKKRLSKLKGESDTLLEMLLNILYALYQKSSDEHLLQLIHHIDFNKWFSKSIGYLNLTVA